MFPADTGKSPMKSMARCDRGRGGMGKGVSLLEGKFCETCAQEEHEETEWFMSCNIFHHVVHSVYP